VGVMFAVSSAFASDRDSGALEHVWGSPSRRDVFVLGAAATAVLYSTVANTLLILLAVGLLHARYHATALLAVPAVAVMVVGLVGYGYLAGSAVLASRRTGALLDGVGYVLAALSGVAFPVAVLPSFFQVAAFALPTTWGLDLLRHWGQGTVLLAPLPAELGALTATSLAFLALGRWAFARTERSLHRAGTIYQH